MFRNIKRKHLHNDDYDWTKFYFNYRGSIPFSLFDIRMPKHYVRVHNVKFAWYIIPHLRFISFDFQNETRSYQVGFWSIFRIFDNYGFSCMFSSIPNWSLPFLLFGLQYSRFQWVFLFFDNFPGGFIHSFPAKYRFQSFHAGLEVESHYLQLFQKYCFVC